MDLNGIRVIAVGVPDHTGRLMGKRLVVENWEAVQKDGLPMPDFHLVTGPENRPYLDMVVTGPHTGFRNGLLRPDLQTIRRLPWQPDTALVIADAYAGDGLLQEEAPRAILRRQLDGMTRRGLTALFASELEFYLLRSSYEEADAADYRGLVPSYHRRGDNDLLIAGYDEPIIGEIRRLMPMADVPVEVSQGEAGRGQHEVNLRRADGLTMADRHVVYKHGVKMIAHAGHHAATFMAKLSSESAGSSCHVHLSMRHSDGSLALGSAADKLTEFGASFLAGLLKFAPDFTLMHAPRANSYKRLQPGTAAPTNATWGSDNRSCLIRTTGKDDGFHFEYRQPGADVNPYLSFAGILAAGFEGVDSGLVPPPITVGDAYASDAPELPRDLTMALGAFERSDVARRALGERVHSHVAGLARHELDASRHAVTDWELRRDFETA